MITYTGALNLYKKWTNNSESANETLGAVMVNEGIRMMMGDIAWPFLEKNTTISTVDGTQFYDLPADLSKTLSVTVTVGTYVYRPFQIFSRNDWDEINSVTGVESDSVSYYYVFDGQIGLWPTPGTSGSTITVNYLKQVRDISVADFTTGSVLSVTSGDETVEGNSPSWTVQMAGKYMRITHSNTANTGDGIWYEIASVTDTDTLELVSPYVGRSISAGTASYIIGDVMVIPENYQLGPVYYAVSEYWRFNDDEKRADRFQEKFDRLMAQMREDEGKKTTNPAIDYGLGGSPLINPNLAPGTISG